MPKLWDDTIEAHRQQVRDAILAAGATLAAEHGPLNVSMSQVALQARIGRATLYKYFASVEEILRAWHDQQVAHHLDQLTEIAGRDEPAAARLDAVLHAYAHIQHHRTGHDVRPHVQQLDAMLHRDTDLAPGAAALHDLVGTLIREAARQGRVRSDVTPVELASFCLHTLSAASAAPSRAAARRLVGLVLDALRPDPTGGA